jgi:hypothetical protein
MVRWIPKSSVGRSSQCARQAHVLLRRWRKWDDLQPLAGIAIDLVSMIEDEMDSAAASGGPST